MIRVRVTRMLTGNRKEDGSKWFKLECTRTSDFVPFECFVPESVFSVVKVMTDYDMSYKVDINPDYKRLGVIIENMKEVR